MARDLDRFVDAFRCRLAQCAALGVQPPITAATKDVLSPGRGRRVVACVWERVPRTLVVTLPDKVCSQLVESLYSIDPFDSDEQQLSSMILKFCAEALRQALGPTALPQALAPMTASRSGVAIGYSPTAPVESALLMTAKGAVGITMILSATTESGADVPVVGKRKRVLIVDDDHMARKLIAKAVADLDVEFTAVNGGTEAIAAANELAPDLVLLDFEMPTMNGHECLVHLRKALPNLEVVMVTARGTADVVKKCIEAGASGFIVKPFRVIDLQQRVRRALDLPVLAGVP